MIGFIIFLSNKNEEREKLVEVGGGISKDKAYYENIKTHNKAKLEFKLMMPNFKVQVIIAIRIADRVGLKLFLYDSLRDGVGKMKEDLCDFLSLLALKVQRFCFAFFWVYDYFFMQKSCWNLSSIFILYKPFIK